MISRRKEKYPISPFLHQYLHHFGRMAEIPLVYDDLLRFTGSIPYENPAGEETLWLEVMYPPEVMRELTPSLTKIYSMLKIGGDVSHSDHLIVDRVDFGEFGNSRPFRIRIVNEFNGNADYYYVKDADASRLYGLELEHILSPFRMNYLVKGNTLIEEHIAGVPGNDFITTYLPREDLNKVRVAKEFVKFAERCYLRLLGDMRTVNYVVDITPDFEEVQYRVRPIDFDQQCYESNLEVYRPHKFADNKPVEDLVRSHLNDQNILQYRQEERSQMARRIMSENRRVRALLRTMVKEPLAPEAHIRSLGLALAEYHRDDSLAKIETMGGLVEQHIRHLLSMKF